MKIGGLAVNVVPPVTHQHLLLEDGAIRAEKAVHAAIAVTHVEDLQRDGKERMYECANVQFLNVITQVSSTKCMTDSQSVF